ncbi:hypothetical protein [Actinoplanes sp. URMC 104]|uniref:hypothetical protein n=1 Tax=Actinoplanes sp. URMC 104 TaxID=3423409 RepID=UPI003F1A5A35
MAEAVIERTTVTTSKRKQGSAVMEQVRRTETVKVASARAALIDVSALRAFVAALDEAEVPGKALVEFVYGAGQVVQLVVQGTEEIDETALPQAGPVDPLDGSGVQA